MIKLIKMECYRLFHMTSTYVMFAVTIALAWVTVYMTRCDLDLMSAEGDFAEGFAAGWNGDEREDHSAGEELSDGEESSDGEEPSNGDDGINVELGIAVETDAAWLAGDIPAGEFLAKDLQSGILLLLCSIFAALFVNAEQKNGYIKNIAGQIPSRSMLALSKFAGVAVQTAVLLLVYLLSDLAFGRVIFGERFVFESAGVLLGTVAVQYLLHLAFEGVITLLCLLTRSTAFSMTAGIMISCGTLLLAAEFINMLVHRLISGAERFDISRCTLEYAVGACSAQSSAGQLGKLALLAAVWLLASALTAGIVYRKRDVR